MTTVHVGLPSMQGSLARYAKHFDLLEVRPVDTSMPRGSKLRAWRKEVPPAFVFSVVLPSALAELRAGADAERKAALKATLEAAEALEARCIVVRTPSAVTPTALHKKRLGELLGELPRDAVHVAWEPRGVWSREEMALWSRDLGVSLVGDASQGDAPPGAVLYTRVRGIGANARVGAGPVAKARAVIAGRREVFVVVEADSPKRIADALRVPLEGASRPAAAVVLRPQVKAEDEEQ